MQPNAEGWEQKETETKDGLEAEGLPVLRPQVAGIDVGSQSHWVCALRLDHAGREVERFGATTPALERLAAWLRERKVESVALESTGLYWIAPQEVLERHGFEVILVRPGNSVVCRAARRRIGSTASGFSGCTGVDYGGDPSGLPSRSACYGRWCGRKPIWWRNERTGFGGCTRAWTR